MIGNENLWLDCHQVTGKRRFVYVYAVMFTCADWREKL